LVVLAHHCWAVTRQVPVFWLTLRPVCVCVCVCVSVCSAQAQAWWRKTNAGKPLTSGLVHASRDASKVGVAGRGPSRDVHLCRAHARVHVCVCV
jgi:hypothetical protein